MSYFRTYFYLLFVSCFLVACSQEQSSSSDTDTNSQSSPNATEHYEVDVTIKNLLSSGGEVSFTPKGQSCANSKKFCYRYAKATEVTVTPISSGDLVFVKWTDSGSCDKQTACTFNVDAPVSLVAEFTAKNLDQDKDGIPDGIDEDRDGDGINNDLEEQVGSNPDNIYDKPKDQDKDGIPDSIDDDRDGDGVTNDKDKLPDNPAENKDLDGDGIGDNADTDRDGDGFSNEIEEQLKTNPDDASDTPPDIDGDKIPDALDDDRDGDGVKNDKDDYPDDKSRHLIHSAINIETPVSGFITRNTKVTVRGTFVGPITAIRVEDTQALISGKTFSAEVKLYEGMNKLTAVGTFQAASGLRAANATRNVILDTTAPYIIISSIKDGMVTTSAEITVAGSLDDLRSNLTAVTEPLVSVNGISVPVVERSFELPNYRLRPGLNIITVQATDALGNSRQLQKKVTYLKDAGQRILEMSGNNQASKVNTKITQPLVVKLVNRNNLPIASRAVKFTVTEGDGELISGSRQARSLMILTDDKGLASSQFKLGKRSGAGKHQVSVSALGFTGTVVFSASAQASVPHHIGVARGSQQTGMMGSVLPDPLIAKVTDANGNAIAGVDVVFKVDAGGGHFLQDSNKVQPATKPQQVTLKTDLDGNAAIDLVLGNSLEDLGDASQVVTAEVQGKPEIKTSFTAHNLRPGNVTDTKISGLVLDNSQNPMPDVTVKIKGNSFNLREVKTDKKGRFEFSNAPVGTVHLILDGATTTRTGEWPHLMFEMVTVSGQNNTVGMPIYFPEVDYKGGKIAGGDKEVVIPMKGVAGAKVIIAPNSMRFPDGRKTGRVMFTQVQTDKVPMPAPNASVFDVAWTLQPAGIYFNPPARVSLPNTFSGAPGEELEMFSFDHDLMEWVSIGPSVVSQDGATITSRIGHGIRHSGWGGAPPPPDDTCNISCNSKDECTHMYRSSTSCSCISEFLKDKVRSQQEPDDCKTLKCSGSDPNDGETPKDATAKGDCKISKCENGSPTDTPDDSDLPDPSQDDSNKCKTCKDGEPATDPSKNDQPCSNKTGQECFVCVDGECTKPDCKASKEKIKVNVGKDNLILEGVKKAFDTISRANPSFNISLSKVRSELEMESGEECCDCEENQEIKNYQKITGSIGGSIKATFALMGVAIKTPSKNVAFGIKVSGVFEAGAAMIKGELSASGGATGKVSKCKNAEKCVDAFYDVSGSIFGGPAIKLEGKIESCNWDYKTDCSDLLVLGAEASVGVTTGVGVGGNLYLGDECTKQSCGFSASLHEGKALINLSLKVVVGGVFEGNYAYERDYVFWEEVTFAGGCP